MQKNISEPKAPLTAVPSHKHWVEKLAQQVLGRTHTPFVVTAGMTTSGPFHMGTLSEFLYPASVVRFLEREGEVKFNFSADILDAFDAVPATMAEFTRELEPHLGKPLCDVPDPHGCCASFGEHFLNESLALAGKFSIHPKIRRASDDYRKGVYDSHAKLYIKNLKLVREVIAETSLNPNLPASWHPLMPQCSNCGRIATTEVKSADSDSYTYACTKELKYTTGCGFVGEHRLSDHRYKLQWRLHWPSWMDINGTHIEGGGMDHHTRGGSWDSCVGVFKQVLHKEPPISYKWGFVLFGGKKYSKSKGIGMGVTDLIKLVPPEVLAYALVRPDLEENRDISPTGDSLLRLLDDYQGAAALAAQIESGAKVEDEDLSPASGEAESDGGAKKISRADRKRALAFQLVAREKIWSCAFTDLLIYHVLYKNWDSVAEKIGNAHDVARLSPYVENWEKSGMVPSQYSFAFNPSRPSSQTGEEFFKRLKPGMPALDIHNLAFAVAREKNLRPGEFFVELYKTILGQEAGPKLGKLIEAIGIERVKQGVLGG